MTGIIAFQGMPGAYSDLACRTARPDMKTLACETFEDAIAAVREARAELAMLPCENSLAGRVPDIHHLLPESACSSWASTSSASSIACSRRRAPISPASSARTRTRWRSVRCADSCASFGCNPSSEADTAGAAQLVAERGDPADAAIASSLAAEIYGLDVLRGNVEDAAHNTTRFYVMARKPTTHAPGTPDLMTTFVFRVRNVPAALYKALGGFATNAVNMTKLESYMLGGRFTATQFLCDVEGHPEQPPLRRALEELSFFSSEVRVLGVYPAAPFRLAQGETQGD